MESRIETLLDAVVNDGTIENFEPRSRVESYLLSCVNGTGAEDDLPEPVSRVDALLYTLAKEGGGSGSNISPIKKLIDDTGSAAYLFYYRSTSTSVSDYIKYGDTSNGTNFGSMFTHCNAITAVPLLDTSNGTNFESMFNNCNAITTVPLLDTSNGTNFQSMFYNCHSLTAIPLLDTSNGTNFQSMFYNCRSLTAIPLLDTSGVTTMYSMFYGCRSLITIPLLNTSKVTSFYNTFRQCVSLTTIPSLDTRSATSLLNMFEGCISLTECGIRNIPCSLQVGSGSTYGHLLTIESLLHLIKELRNMGTSYTFTIGSANLEKLTDVYVKTIEITDEMREEDEFIDEKIPFEVCESTDEGALLVTTEYPSLKNWTIK